MSDLERAEIRLQCYEIVADRYENYSSEPLLEDQKFIDEVETLFKFITKK